ncbi:phosphatidylinositol-glycan biosynthesis class W protein isoform X2 [Dendropsophus ebraccatus]
MSVKQLKESFVTDLNGTSIWEISLGLVLTPLCILFRGLALISLHQTFGDRVHSWPCCLLLDFVVLVVPQILSCTVLSDHLCLVVGLVSLMCTLGCYVIYNNRISYKDTSLLNVCQSFLNKQIEDRNIPSVTTFRVFINLLTAISILAVDFSIFPRRYAKTETYGTGVMDLGVGCFTFANALISPEARSQNKGRDATFYAVKKQLFAVWPLVFLGLGRLISVRAVDYHLHVSEYGLHWNFFFTLAIVRVVSSLLLALLPQQRIWIVAASIIVGYQIVLETTNLKSFILYGGNNDGTRHGFLNANREGIFSAIGYVGIYMIGVQIGSYLLKKRQCVMEWIRFLLKLTLFAIILFIAMITAHIYVEPISRRIANLPFCMWTIGQSMIWLCEILLCDLILVFVQYVTPGSHVPSTWIMYKDCHQKPRPPLKTIHFCLIEAINRNQLLFFLHSNIMTGIVNLTIDTIQRDALSALIILLIYMFGNCFISYILHVNNITIKWW